MHPRTFLSNQLIFYFSDFTFAGNIVPGQKSICPQCGRLYEALTSLRRHIKYECGKEPSFRCHLCPYAAKLKENLKRHMLCRHRENQVFCKEMPSYGRM